MFAWLSRHRSIRDAAVLEALGDSEMFGGDIAYSAELRYLSTEKFARHMNSMVARELLTCRDKPFHYCGRQWKNIRCWRASGTIRGEV